MSGQRRLLLVLGGQSDEVVVVDSRREGGVFRLEMANLGLQVAHYLLQPTDLCDHAVVDVADVPEQSLRISKTRSSRASSNTG